MPAEPLAEPLVVNMEPAVEDMQFLQERLYEHNVAQTGYDDGEWLAFFIRDTHQRIQAGLYGSTWGGCCYIRYLWVHEDWRGQGYGTRLLHAAEHEAQSRGCDAIILDTHSFQAPGFYQKLGYEVFAILEDYPRGHRNYYLRKRLR